MSQSPFFPTFRQLGKTIPIFPLRGALLLPRGTLPLNIFEPRYIAMVDDALASDRMIGMVQPVEGGEEPDGTEAPAVYGSGCAGRITSFEETDDGRYLITLTGVIRFRIAAELPALRGYRRVRADWQPFSGDLAPPEPAEVDRKRLIAGLTGYFRRQGIQVNWQAVEDTPDERLVTALCMICPFPPTEKQALLEAPTLAERARMMMALIEMAVLDRDDDGRVRH